MRGRRGGYYGAGGGLIGLLAVMLLAIYAMPFVGGYVLITGKNDSSKLLEKVLSWFFAVSMMYLGMNVSQKVGLSVAENILGKKEEKE